MVSEVCRVFNRALFGGGHGNDLLQYLVLGDQEMVSDESRSVSEVDARSKFPRLYAKLGHRLQAVAPIEPMPSESALTLSDFFGAELYDQLMNKANHP